MDGGRRRDEPRSLTPAVLASATFTTACAVFAVIFVAARGGLQMPVAGTQAPLAVSTEAPATLLPTEPAAPPPPATRVPTPEPTARSVAPTPTVAPSPTLLPTAKPTQGAPSPSRPSTRITRSRGVLPFARIRGRSLDR